MTIPTEPIGSITSPLGLIEAVTLRASIVPPCISTRPLTSNTLTHTSIKASYTIEIIFW